MSSTPQPDQKDVAYYAAQANAWFNTALEHDKSILALSSGAIGLLITLLTTVGANSQLDQWLFGAALLSFVVSVVTILVIFRRNKSYLEDLVARRESKLESELMKYDLVVICAFGLGILLTVAIGVSTIVQSHRRSTVMPDRMTSQEALRITRDERLIESYAGANKMRAEPEEVRSFAGAGRVAPNSEASATTQPATQAPEPATLPASSTPADPKSD